MQKTHRPLVNVVWRSLLHAPHTPLGEGRARGSRLLPAGCSTHQVFSCPLGWAMTQFCRVSAHRQVSATTFSGTFLRPRLRPSRNADRALKGETSEPVGGLDAVGLGGLIDQLPWWCAVVIPLRYWETWWAWYLHRLKRPCNRHKTLIRSRNRSRANNKGDKG